MKKCRLFIMMLAVVLCSGNLMDAQAASENGNIKAPTMEEMAETQMTRLQETLKLDDNAKEKFASLYKKYYEELSDCYPKWKSADNNATRSDKKIKSQIKKSFVAERAAIDVQAKYYEMFAEFLNGEQLEQLFNPFTTQFAR